MQAILSLLPLTVKGTTPHGGALQEAFLWAAAALLAIHGQYSLVIAELNENIAATHGHGQYSEDLFGPSNVLGVDQMALFLACTGVSVDEAETWHPWAAAFIKMDLTAHPNSTATPMLHQARELMQAHTSRKMSNYDLARYACNYPTLKGII
jgi:hypothetical protein